MIDKSKLTAKKTAVKEVPQVPVRVQRVTVTETGKDGKPHPVSYLAILLPNEVPSVCIKQNSKEVEKNGKTSTKETVLAVGRYFDANGEGFRSYQARVIYDNDPIPVIATFRPSNLNLFFEGGEEEADASGNAAGSSASASPAK